MTRPLRAAGLGIPGLVDRMILAAAQAREARLWTLDRTLARAATKLGVAQV